MCLVLLPVFFDMMASSRIDFFAQDASMYNPRNRRRKHALFFFLDTVSLAASISISYLGFLLLQWQTFAEDTLLMSGLALLLLTPMSHLAVGLYESKIRENTRQVLRRGILSVGLVFIAYQVLASLNAFEPHNLTIIVGLLLGVALQTGWRHWAIAHGGMYVAKRRVVFIGAGERAAFLPNRMRRDVDRKHFDGWSFLPLQRTADAVLASEHLIPCPEGTSLIDHLCQIAPDVIVLSNDPDEKPDVQALLSLKMSGVEVVELEDFIEYELGQLAVEHMRPEWLLLSKGFHLNRLPFEVLNYAINAVLATVVLVLTWPLMIGAIVAIYVDDGRRDGAGFLYRQTRVGRGGKLFSILKFRSMGKHAEAHGAQWAQKNDVRVTRVGKYLRKYRIDELPQLLNVLRGDMCFVGPRPERPEFVTELAKEIPFFDYRHCVKPGLTGWAQVHYPYGASTKDSAEKLKFDLYYIKHRSLLLDLFVLLRTVEIVLFGQGR